MTILISGVGIAGPALAYWLVRRGHRPVLIERMPELRVGGHAVDIRGTALGVTERMGLSTAVREARTNILTLSAVRPDGRRSHDVALRPLHEARGDREVEIMRDDLVRILFGAIADHSEVVFGDTVRAVLPQDGARIGVEFERGAPREVDVVVGADGQHSALRELVFGPERQFTHHLGAYLSIYTVDNLLGLRDAQCYTTSPAGPRRCSPCAATNGPRWCCSFAATRSTSISRIRLRSKSCCIGALPGWVGRQGDCWKPCPTRTTSTSTR